MAPPNLFPRAVLLLASVAGGVATSTSSSDVCAAEGCLSTELGQPVQASALLQVAGARGKLVAGGEGQDQNQGPTFEPPAPTLDDPVAPQGPKAALTQASQGCSTGYMEVAGRCTRRPATAPEVWVKATNIYRCMHGGRPVTWSTAAAANAQAYVDTLTSMVHSSSYTLAPPAGPAGENLAMGYGSIEEAVGGWYSEVDCCQSWPGCETKSCTVGHFTALVWAGVSEIGCAVNSQAIYICRYRSGDTLSALTANMQGYYTQNVQRATVSADTCIQQLDGAPPSTQAPATTVPATTTRPSTTATIATTRATVTTTPAPAPATATTTTVRTTSTSGLPLCTPPASGSRGQCQTCFISAQCATGMFCCPFLKKCVPTSSTPCGAPFGNCLPTCSDSTCNAATGCTCTSCPNVGPGKTYEWLVWANLAGTDTGNAIRTCFSPTPTTTPTLPPTTTAPPTAPAGANIWVTSGPCAYDAAGCVTTPGFPANYPTKHACTIRTNPGLAVSAPSFATEATYDYVTINGRFFSGTAGPQGVVPTGDITWTSDATSVAGGWRLCAAPPTTTTINANLPVCTSPVATRGQCQTCFMDAQCVAGMFCCPFLKKCVPSSSTPCGAPFGNCSPTCSQTTCNAATGCTCTGCPDVGPGKTYDWLVWANLGGTENGNAVRTCRYVAPSTTPAAPTTSTTTLPTTTATGPAGASIWVASGPCLRDSTGCVTSPNYPSAYGTSQSCTIKTVAGAVVTSSTFSTESGFDKLTVSGQAFSGSAGPKGRAVTGDITWSSDSSVVSSGWRLCTGTPSPTTSTTTVSMGPSPAGAFTVKSGPCRVDATNCVVSPNFPSAYGNMQTCTIGVAAGLVVGATSFATEAGRDMLIVNSVMYSGTVGPQGITPSGDMQWLTDGSNVQAGWRLCARVR